MNNRRQTSRVLSNFRFLVAQYWAYLLVGSNVAVILSVTLYPYTFINQDYLSLIMLLKGFFKPNSDLYDVISNVLLFLALGFGVGRIFQQRFSGKGLILIISLLLSANLSLMVEILQIFLPRRTSSLWDLGANVLGGVLGTVAFYLWKPAQRGLNMSRRSKSRLSFAALSYASLILCLMFSLQRNHNFSNWNSNFPLSIGNEQTGDRPWNGMISQVYFANRSLSTAEVSQILIPERSRDPTLPWLTGYQLTGNGDYPDQNGLSPDLEWRKYPPESQAENQGMIALTQEHWLLTPKPATELIQAIQKTSQFSLLTTVATRDINQTGPARIISLAASPFRRNLTIGQQGSSLIVRLRTPLSGLGETNTNLTFPDIFADTNRHQLLLNFEQNTLQLFVDKSEEVSTLKLSPEILFFHFLPAIGIRNFQVTPSNQWMLQLAFYVLVLSLPATLLLL